MTDSILETKQLSKKFGEFVAVDSVDMTVEIDEIKGLIGPNGAGKTTFFNLVTGNLTPTGGQIWFKDTDITGAPPHEIPRLGLSATFQITSVFPELTVKKNMLGSILGEQKLLSPIRSYGTDPEQNKKIREVLSLIDLEESLNRTVGNLSHADQKILEIGIALAADPDLLFLDEPTAGLSASETNAVRALLNDLRGEVTIILIEHDMDLVMDTVDSLTVLHNGSIVAEGTPQQIRSNERVQEIYFGRN